MTKKETKELISKIKKKIKAKPGNVADYENLFQVCRNAAETDFELAHKVNRELRGLVTTAMRIKGVDHNALFGVYKRSLLFDAPHSLDCYLLYVELNRAPEARFYQPRRNVLKQVVDALQDLTDDKLDELFLSMPPRVGKLVADSTPVLTTNGWKRHGDLVVGDFVFNENGEAKSVLAVHPKNETEYTVKFADGSEIKCHGNHEWVVYDRRFGKIRTVETKEMVGHTENGSNKGFTRGHRYNFMLPLRKPLIGVEADLPVPPYVLGAWLGDGTNRKPCITGDKKDRDIAIRIQSEKYKIAHEYTHKTTGAITYAFETKFRTDLQKLDMCYCNKTVPKRIPDVYMTASKNQRLELLAGLIDTDGCLRGKEHRYDYVTCEEQLRDDVVSLIATFGWRTTVQKKEPCVSSSGIVGKKAYWVISFNPTEYIPCVLDRKKLYAFSKQRRVSITEIVRSEPEPGNCITVDGGVYCVGRKMIPTHNSSLIKFYFSWIIGRDPENPNLYSSYTDIITKAFYNGVLEIITDKDTYLWADVFPGVDIARTNAADETIDIGRRKHYPTLTCRSIDGTLNGACDAQNGVIAADDLISGIEEALSKDRLMGKWSKVDNNLIPRGKGKTKYLWIGTRWSVIDPAGVRLDTLENDEKYKDYRWRVINLPALNENDESNFDYPYGVGFNTLYYQRRRASFERNNDVASWLAQYMGMPIERMGVLFEPDGLRYYNGVLPDGEPDRVFMPVDPAFGGGDFVAGPVLYQYGEDLYMHDVVYDNADKRVTIPLIVQAVQRNNIGAIQVEANKTLESYKDEIDAALRAEGLRINLTGKPAPTNKGKAERIFDKAPEIREHVIFLENGKRNKAYSLFMQNVFSYKILGKNKNDDAPDSLSMAMDMFHPDNRRLQTGKNPFKRR